MAYQRFGNPGSPQAYIWSSGEELHLIAQGEAHDGSHYERGFVEVVFDVEDTRTAENLFIALYDYLTEDAGKTVRFNKKTGEIKIKKRKR